IIVVSAGDPSFAVEPDYERRAERWDEHRAQLARNAHLGWTVDVHLHPLAAPGRAELQVQLFDRWGKPIRDAQGGGEAFHLARAARRLPVTLTHRGDGLYAAVLEAARPGQWE